MALIVQKYGGTSVATSERIQAVAERIHQTAAAGNSLVVVVSAMGKTTDMIVDLAHQISSRPSQREMDMLLSTGEQISIALLSIALQERGQAAISLTGAQAGIVTEAKHSRARILDIKTERIVRHLKEGKVVVVAGFQGISQTSDLEITTLGRGGSDTSAVALAAALQTEKCEIYTDVPGIFTADPRLVPEAQLIDEITCDEMLELADLGARVLHPRSVEIARNYGVTLVVRSSWSQEPGTRVISPQPQPRSLVGMEIAHSVDAIEFDANQSKLSRIIDEADCDVAIAALRRAFDAPKIPVQIKFKSSQNYPPVRGAALDHKQARLAIRQVPDQSGIAAQILQILADRTISVDMFIQSQRRQSRNGIITRDIAFIVAQSDANIAMSILQSAAAKFGYGKVTIDTAIAKVSVVGIGMIYHPGVAAQMFKALTAKGVNIQMIATSEIKVSCIVSEKDALEALRVVHTAFNLANHGLKGVIQA